MSIRPPKKYAGITLIEVLVAIYVFGIGILVVMRMLISNISWLYDIRAKDTAVSLAKESMDIVFHLRDSNIEKGMPRDCRSISLSPGWQCDGSLLTSALNRYQVNRTLTGLYQLSGIVNTGDAVIWYHTGAVYTQSGQSFTGFWYNHDSVGGVVTPYTRWIEIFPQTNYPGNTGQILGIRSIVVYQRGNRSQEVVLESILGDMR